MTKAIITIVVDGKTVLKVEGDEETIKGFFK